MARQSAPQVAFGAALTASQSSYFRKSELCPLLINNYIISGAWADDQRRLPRVVGDRQYGWITCMLAACVVRRLHTG